MCPEGHPFRRPLHIPRDIILSWFSAQMAGELLVDLSEFRKITTFEGTSMIFYEHSMYTYF